MEAEKEEDRFASITKHCQPTASQEAKFDNCPFAFESENFVDSNPDQFSSSPDPTPPEPTGIVMFSLPDSGSSVLERVEDDAVFHTPPEHSFHSQLSSLENQNHDELCAEGLRSPGVGNGSSRSKKVRSFEGGLDDDKLKKMRVPGVELDGETVPLGETETIVIESEGNQGVHDTEVIVLDSADSGEETAINLAKDSIDIIGEAGVEVGRIEVVRKIGELMKDGLPEVDANDENHQLGKKCESVKDDRVNKGEKPYKSSNFCGSSDSGKIKEEIFKLKCIAGNGCIEIREGTGVRGSEEVVKVTEDEKICKDGYRDGGLRTNGKRIEEIDEFRYVGGNDVERRWEGRRDRALGGSGRRRQLPISMKGKEKNVGGGNVVETMETKIGLLDFLDVLKVVVGDTDGGCADVEFLETAKRRGLTFPRARWWPPEDDDE